MILYVAPSITAQHAMDKKVTDEMLSALFSHKSLRPSVYLHTQLG